MTGLRSTSEQNLSFNYRPARSPIAVGPRTKARAVRFRPFERAAFFEGYSNQKFKSGIVQAASAAFGNAATRLAAFVVKGGPYAYGNDPEIDTLYQRQAVELDHKKRAAILDKMQQLVSERVIYAPLLQLAFINGVGPRVGESGFGLIPGFAYTGPFEDITLKRS
jgi:peptide/nickel transport system substrate-binding protein